ncbi:MAG: Gfo/Idh/MocA family oxidoreductase [Saprospiraceae bacterium]
MTQKAINTIGHQRNFEDVVEALENGRAPFVTGEEALQAVEVIDAIYRSAKADGKWVNLNG